MTGEQERTGAGVSRRRFTSTALGAAAVLALGGVAGGKVALDRRLAGLGRALCPLADRRFASFASEVATGQLVLELMGKGVIGPLLDLDVDRVEALAASDRLVGHDDLYYTETELQVYALAVRLLTRDDLSLLDRALPDAPDDGP